MGRHKRGCLCGFCSRCGDPEMRAKEIAQMWLDGMSYTTIADLVGCTPGRVSQMVKMAGARDPAEARRRMRAAGEARRGKRLRRGKP